MTWYNTNWKYRKKITIDNTKVGADLIDYPVYLDLSELGTDFFDNVKSDGGDIRITTSDEETEVPREIVSCDTTAETGEVHFKGDLSGSTDTDFYVYYGNSEASDYAITATYGAENVWNSNYKAVYHLEDANDSTSNSNDGTATGATSGATGKIEDAYSFDGTGDYIEIPDSTAFNFGTGAFTLTFWLKKTASGRGDFFGWKNFAVNPDDFGIFIDDAEKLSVYLKVDGVGGYVIENGSAKSINTFYKIDIVRDSSGNISSYINNSLDGTGSSSANLDNIDVDTTIWLGANRSDSTTPALEFTGIIDETRFINTELSSDFRTTEYNNQNSPSTFYTIGIQEESKISSNTIFLSNNF